MPFYRRGRGSYRRRSRGVSGGGFRGPGKSQPRLVRSMPLRAVHFFSTYQSQASPIGARVGNMPMTLMNPVQRGSSIQERTGNRIKNLSLLLNGGIIFNPYATGFGTVGINSGIISQRYQTGQDCALIIAWSPTQLASAPTLAQVYGLTPGNSQIDTWSMPLVTDLPTLRVLYRKNYQFRCVPNGNNSSTQALYSAPAGYTPVRIKLNLRGAMTTFNNTPGVPAVGDIVSGSLWLFLLGDYVDPPAAGIPEFYQRPNLIYEMRIAYTNMD